ncbi:hypothetical protein [Pandoraea pnomenusa]|uniref:TRADD-N-associated membrane domain-containing protein n=1 Tax=Pandoraea pnomenusa TaxID=93220 RepID=UPI0033408977
MAEDLDNIKDSLQKFEKSTVLDKRRRSLETLWHIAFGLAIFSFLLTLALGLLSAFSDGEKRSLLQNATLVAAFCTGILTIAGGEFGIKFRKLEGDMKVASAELAAKEAPHSIAPAWDVARARLERHIDLNLSQSTWIFGLALMLFIFGFALIVWGLYSYSTNGNEKWLTVISSTTGSIVTIVGSSLLVLYKATSQQAVEFVQVLARINAVGMAMQILDSIPDQAQDTKHQATAEVAKQLISSYSDARK